MKSPSKEIRFLCNVLVNDPRSTIGQNVWYLNRITNSDILRTSSTDFKKLLPVNNLPENEVYRVRLLTTLLQVRDSKQFEQFNLTKKQTSDLIESLCIS